VVAVLPLTNLTGDADQDATVVGIAEVVVGALTQIEGVQVLSRSATLAYRDRKQDLAAIARELDASYLVDGVLQRSQQQLRVSFSLVRSPTSVVAWSGTFDGAFPQLFDLQSRVATEVANALRIAITPRARERIEAHPTASPSAWEDYATALALLDRADRPGNAERAVTRLEAAVAADPRFASAQALLGRAFWLRYQETGDTAWADRARDAVQEALRLAPDDADARLALAVIYEGRGKRAEALEETRKALALRPGSDDVLRRLAYLLVDDGQPDAALDAVRRALALRPRFAENQNVLGWVHFQAGRFRDAAGAYRRLSELQPDNAWAFQMLGTSLQMQGDLDGAEPAYREAIRLAPDARAWANLGSVYYTRGSLPDAVRAYEEAARLEPVSGTIRRSLGDVRAKAGDAGGARADWQAGVDLSRAALRTNPRDFRQLKNTAICLAKLGQREEALRTAAEALAAGPANADAHYGSAIVHALLGDTEQALALLEKALALGASATLAERDEELASLRALPGFRPLVEKAKKSHTKEVNRAS
jgi:tetratricopeptide (TPR) repeat protein